VEIFSITVRLDLEHVLFGIYLRAQKQK